MKRWVDYLPEDIYIRLCECRTIKADLKQLVKCKWATSLPPATKEDALVYILDLLDANGCGMELSSNEWDELTR